MFTLPTLEQVQAAQSRLRAIRRTPLIECEIPGLAAQVYLKLECLQVSGSFKVRGAGNAMLLAAKNGSSQFWTASAGNMGLGVAWYAKRAGFSSMVIVPEDAPRGKIETIKASGAEVVELPRDDYWAIQKTHQSERGQGHFIHPFADTDVMAGNGTLALEILEDLPDLETIITPYGGGGLSCGVAAAVKALAPEVAVYAAETESGAPLAPSLRQGQMTRVEYWKSFVSGMGSPTVFPQMWPLVKEQIAGSVVVSLPGIAESMRLLLDVHHLVTEGAGAISLAAARTGAVPGKKIVCILSGGNIQWTAINEIFQELGVN